MRVPREERPATHAPGEGSALGSPCTSTSLKSVSSPKAAPRSVTKAQGGEVAAGDTALVMGVEQMHPSPMHKSGRAFGPQTTCQGGSRAVGHDGSTVLAPQHSLCLGKAPPVPDSLTGRAGPSTGTGWTWGGHLVVLELGRRPQGDPVPQGIKTPTRPGAGLVGEPWGPRQAGGQGMPRVNVPTLGARSHFSSPHWRAAPGISPTGMWGTAPNQVAAARAASPRTQRTSSA